MQVKEHNASLPIQTRNADSERVSLTPIPDTSKSSLFNFNTCGINTLLSDSSNSYPIPWTGNVFSNATFFNVSRCSVTLISEWYAVGPAYCFGDVQQEHYIVFGADGDSTIRKCDKSNTTGPCMLPTQRILVEKIIIHPQYDRASYSNDIALAKLTRPVDTSQRNVRPICLPLLDEVRSYDRSNLMMSSTTGTVSKFTVTRVENRYLELDECKQRWKGLAVSFAIENTKSCIITKRSSDDACVGVFTGAALHTLQRVQSSERHFLRGFVLIMPRGCSVYYPAVYTNTDHYLSWILENMDEPLYPSEGSTDLRERLIFN
uniref:Peptidase S1 domain-containing protein n=1 Tax=Anopheles maculatus TaxID=74869 RepID=A0A182TBI5_9DIPT